MHEARVRARARALPPAFLKEIARPDLDAKTTHAAIAGLIVLRMVDRWVAGGCRPVDVEGARKAVEEMDAGNAGRNALGLVLVGLSSDGVDRRDEVIRHLIAYARSLEFDAKWAMAIAVYHAVVDALGVASSERAACDAWLRRGFCLRMLGELPEAEVAYARAYETASALGDSERALRAEGGSVLVDIARGNLDEVDARLEELIARAHGAGLDAVRATFLHDRAVIAGMRGSPARAAVGLAFEALELTTDPSERDRILFDTGEALRAAGMRDPARDAFLILSCTARERQVRWHAAIMLMRIAADDGRPDMFDDYSNSIDVAVLPPQLHIEYLLQSGYSRRRFGDNPGAAARFSEAIALAEAQGQTNQLREAKRAASGVSDAAETPDPETTAGLDAVVNALRLMRESTVSV